MHDRFMERIFLNLKSVEWKAIWVVSIICTIVLAVIFFNQLDNVPASPEDFEELHEKLLMVQEKPEEFMKNKGKISITDNEIEYEIENDECKIKGKYTLDYKLIGYTQEDNSKPLSSNIFVSIMFGLVVMCLSCICTFLLVFVGESIVIGIILLVRKLKKKI